MDFLNNAILAPVYYAGLFDGEGSVAITLNAQKQPMLHIKLINAFQPALMYPLNKFGGRIENNKASAKNALWVDTFSWKAHGVTAYEFLEWIYPFTIVKRDQVDVAIEFWRLIPPRNNIDPALTDQYIATLKKLKRGR
jgi:hypothetical protein